MKAAAPETTKEVPVYVLSWIFRSKTDSGELIKVMKDVGVNSKELIKMLRCLSALISIRANLQLFFQLI